jgi:hypothetical protein
MSAVVCFSVPNYESGPTILKYGPYQDQKNYKIRTKIRTIKVQIHSQILFSNLIIKSVPT